MKRFIKILLVVMSTLMSALPLRAQYYSWGASPSSIKWNRLRADSIKLIYPSYWEDNARRTLWLFDTIRPHVSYGFSRPAARTPVIIQTQNMVSNGVVTYAPKRIELISFPGIDGFAEPWMKQLIAHEYRHSVQFNNLNRSTIKALSVILGQQGLLIGSLVLPTWFMEGDAVMAETQMTTYGRALQPSFTMEYRALGRINPRSWQVDRWFCGSYKHHIPDHYKMGYQMTRWSYENLGEDVWDRVTRYSSDYPFFLLPRAIFLKRKYNITGTEMFRRTFNELADFWDSLPKVDDSAHKINTQVKCYTTYSHPQWLNDTTVVAFREDLDNVQAIVQVDSRTGHEQVLRRVGRISSRPTMYDGKMFWTEYRQSTVWDERVNSQLCAYDFAEGRKYSIRSKHQIFLPTPTDDGVLCYVTWDYSGRFAIRRGFDKELNRYEFEPNIEIRSLAWDSNTDHLYFIALDERGSWIGVLKDDWSGYEELTEPRFITISDLRASNGVLYFGSIVSGKDEAHALELATRTEYRLTESAYGSFQPAPDAQGRRAVVTTYDSLGYKLAIQELATRTEQPYRRLPVNLVNPPTTKWDVVNLDSIRFTPTADSLSLRSVPSKRYRKGLTGFNVHSWAPFDMNPLTLLSDGVPDLNVGATVMSQNLLSSMVCYAGWGWSQTMGSRYRMGVEYSGWGPRISFAATYGGGNQLLYNRPNGTPLPKLHDALNLSLAVSQPLWLGSGHMLRRLTPSLGFSYTNDMFYRGTTPQTGVYRLSGALSYVEQARMAHRDFAPRWGYALQLSFVSNPLNRDFRPTYLVYARGYLPGAAAHHSMQLQFGYQTSPGNRKFGFRIKELFPRGAEYNFTPKRYIATSAEYQLPVAYPDWGIPSILYIARIRTGAFIDYAHFQTLDNRWRRLFSYGVNVTFDVGLISLPLSSATSLTITVAKPSDRRGVVGYVSLGLPL
ncbi:MAG: hypothetical protein J6K81_02070 [Rikenellaceae bacterium]|nr:hypothetical protein [Rikenellaceae bacterium]